MLSGALLVSLGPVLLIASLAMPAGIGGGLLYVPLLVFTGVTPDISQAAALAQPLIFGATLAAISYNLGWQWRHPGQRLMEPRLALAAVPPCLAGTLAGAMLNQLLPSLVIQIMLFIVLGMSVKSSLAKGRSLWKKESLALRASEIQKKEEPTEATESSTSPAVVTEPSRCSSIPFVDSEDRPYPSVPFFPCHEEDKVDSSFRRRTITAAELGQNSPTPPLSPVAGIAPPAATAPAALAAPVAAVLGAANSSLPPSTKATRVEEDSLTDSKSWNCCKILQSQKSLSNFQVWSGMAVVWAILVVCLVLRGGKKGPSIIGVRMCSPEYWVITGIGFVFLLAAGGAARHPDVKTSSCFAVGCVGSIVGIGGGVMLNPMLLAMGLPPQVATATVTLMVTMVSSNATINFLVAGAIPLVPTLALSAATFLGSLCGKSVVGWVVSRTGRNSILVFMLVGFMVVSLAVAVFQTIEGVKDDLDAGVNPFLTFEDPCKAH